MTPAKIGLAVVVAALLLGCNTATTRHAFLKDFEPSNQRIHGYDRAASVPYSARLTSNNLAHVNAAVNAIPYRRDPRNEWIPPRDFWRRGGDCEDYAMTKAAELKAAGRRGLWIAVLTDGPDGEAHAVLVADDGGRIIALDNQTARPVPWAQVQARFRPAYIIDIETGGVYRAKRY